MRNEHKVAEALPSPMGKINGPRIRQLRESNNLTQLYLATAVGVTTDTVSRWENKRYPTIKRDNAEKLAEALGVPLAEILEKGDDRQPLAEASFEPGPPSGDQVSEPELSPGPEAGLGPPERKKSALLHAGLILLFLAVPIAWRVYSIQPSSQKVAVLRLLPEHATVNQVFPVLLVMENVETQSETPATFIIKEEVPAGSEVLQALPPPATIDPEKNTIKWVNRATASRSVFAYLVRLGPGQPLDFTGSITVKADQAVTDRIAGPGSIRLGIHHWADTNQDNRIDDDEILAVYDTYDRIPGLNIEFAAIDSIWSAKGYRWDATRETIEVIR